MKTTGKAPVAGTNNFNEEQPPLRAAFAVPVNREIADKDEDSLFEGAD
ncbi:MAG: hypothetical protein SGJ27_30605 [Candidatus Melainabacteria bacterium]|nr:hypothetical protein [Candidatus Melainabacteria bacterium]